MGRKGYQIEAWGTEDLGGTRDGAKEKRVLVGARINMGRG